MAENTNEPVVVDNGTPAEPVPVTLKDDDIVEVIYKGEPVRKPWKEARANIQMQHDYTQSKQELAKQAAAVKELNDTLNSRMATVAEKELALDKILGRTSSSDVKQGLADDEVPTVKSVREMVQEAIKSVTENVTRTVDGKLTEATQRDQYQRWDTLTANTVEALQKEHPLLANIPELDAVLKKQAMQDKPTNEKEMTTAMVKAGKAIAKKLDDAYAERRKQDTLKKQDLSTKGPIHEGGSPQFKIPEKSFIKKGTRNTIDFDAIEQEVLTQYNED